MVVVKIAVGDGESGTFGPDARGIGAAVGPIARYGRSGKFNILHRRVIAAQHPYSFAVGNGGPHHVEVGHPTDSAQRQIASGPNALVADIIPRINTDGIAIANQGAD